MTEASHTEFATHLRRQAVAVYAACDRSVADDLAASLLEAADRIVALQREVFMSREDSQ